ncbi:MAG: hypothetical protein L3J88_05000 [Gammaproteobacteria bacterium]|nr:hypothetical protein [Gammaproteobacteria bacterium]
MSLVAILSAIPAAAGFIAWILFVIFGQVTVRKLRKNPETKHELGIEFVSGWDILNVAQALTLPKSVAQKIRRNSMGFEADPDLLYKHTTVFDRVLARVFYMLFAFSGFGLIVLGVLHWFGVFD